MPFVAAFTAAEIAAAEAAAVAAAEIAAAEAAAAAAAQAAAASSAAAAAPTAAAAAAPTAAAAAPTVGGPMAMGLPEATALAPLEAGIAGVPAAAEPAAAATRSLAFGAQPVPAAGSSVATTAGAAPVAPAAPAGGILQAAPSNAPLLNEYGDVYTLAAPAQPAAATATAAQPAAATQTAASRSLMLPPGAAPEAGYAVEGAAGPSAFDKFSAFADKHPFMTGAALYTGATTLGLLDPRGAEMPQRRSYGPQYTLSPNFRGTDPTANVYQPSYQQYAEGGIMGPQDSDEMAGGGIAGYARGGALSDALDFYKNLAEGERGRGASAPKGEDVGIYYDLDPDTRYQDALTAAQIRQAKLNKRSNVRMPATGVMRRPTPMGQINLAPPGTKEETAAQGGIMQASDSSLGSYAAGGSPRLLRGPGDGMSDNIPAMIGKKQPARLADGEFVIPADVVSHLGNGSTEAGAKRLHEMMDKVRKARTGNPKQGKQINPKKYMPA